MPRYSIHTCCNIIKARSIEPCDRAVPHASLSAVNNGNEFELPVIFLPALKLWGSILRAVVMFDIMFSRCRIICWIRSSIGIPALSSKQMTLALLYEFVYTLQICSANKLEI